MMKCKCWEGTRALNVPILFFKNIPIILMLLIFCFMFFSYDKEENLMVCTVCKKHPNLSNKDSVYSTAGSHSMRVKGLKVHWTSDAHQRCLAAENRVCNVEQVQQECESLSCIKNSVFLKIKMFIHISFLHLYHLVYFLFNSPSCVEFFSYCFYSFLVYFHCILCN